MRTRSYLSAAEPRQASRKDCHEKRPGAFEHTRPFVSVISLPPVSKDQWQCRA